MRILVAGANGLVGQGVVKACLADPGVGQVAALVRHPSGFGDQGVVDIVCPDFSRLEGATDRLRPFDACLYCAGAPPVGTPESTYRHVTVELTAHVADVLARLNPGLRFVYVSGAHANPDSAVMPLRIKGEAERALAALPMRSIMLRPGGIQPVDGVRSPRGWMDALYRVAGPAMGLGVRLAPGLMTTTGRIGRAMLALLRQDEPPAIVENAQINRLGADPAARDA